MTLPIDINLNHLSARPAEVCAALALDLAASGRMVRGRDGGLLLLEEAGTVAPVSTVADWSMLESVNILRLRTNNEGEAPRETAKLHVFARLHAAFKAGSLLDRIPRTASVVQAPAYKLTPTGLVPRPVGVPDLEDRVLAVSSHRPPASTKSLDPACPHLKAWFSGLVPAAPIYEANALAIVCACAARCAIEQFPLVLFEATHKSAGKTTAALALAALINETPFESPMTFTGDEAELEKRFSDVAGKPGPVAVVFDNVRPKSGQSTHIKSQALASLTSCHSFRARVLNRGPVPVNDPLIFFTVNGGRVEQDLSDKTVRLSWMLPPGSKAHRELVPQPMVYMKAHRAELWAEIDYALRTLVLPPVSACNTRFYDFERVALGAAQVLGVPADFSPCAVHTADAFILELHQLLSNEFNGVEATFSAVIDSIRTNNGLRALNDWLTQQPGTRNSYPALFRERIQILEDQGQQFRIKDKVVTFQCYESKTLNQMVLNMKEEAA